MQNKKVGDLETPLGYLNQYPLLVLLQHPQDLSKLLKMADNIKKS